MKRLFLRASAVLALAERPRRPTCRGPPAPYYKAPVTRRSITGPGSISASTAAAPSAVRPGIRPAAATSRRPGRRHRRLQLSDRPGRGRRRRRHRLGRHQRHHHTACPVGCKTSDTWLSTVRGRLGYAADRFMPYITGGAAFGDIRASTPGFARRPTTKPAGRSAAALKCAHRRQLDGQGRISLCRSRQVQLRPQLRRGRRPTTCRSTPTCCAPA